MRELRLVVPLLAAVVASSAAVAQTPPVEYRNVISANPFLILAEWFNAEYERRSSLTTTVGVRGSIFIIENGEDETYMSGRGFYRYYPGGAYTGFFVGADFGLTSIDEGDESETVIGAGFELGYNWLLGARRKFYISLGAGMDRLFGGDLGGNVLPTIRIVNIGIAF